MPDPQSNVFYGQVVGAVQGDRLLNSSGVVSTPPDVGLGCDEFRVISRAGVGSFEVRDATNPALPIIDTIPDPVVPGAMRSTNVSIDSDGTIWIGWDEDPGSPVDYVLYAWDGVDWNRHPSTGELVTRALATPPGWLDARYGGDYVFFSRGGSGPNVTQVWAYNKLTQDTELVWDPASLGLGVQGCPDYIAALPDGKLMSGLISVTGAGGTLANFAKEGWYKLLVQSPKLEPVKARSATNIDLTTSPSTIDGVAISVGDRVLLAGQTILEHRGVYVRGGSSYTRAPDADTAAELSGVYVDVIAGTAAGLTFWQNPPISTLATPPSTAGDPVGWAQLGGAAIGFTKYGYGGGSAGHLIHTHIVSDFKEQLWVMSGGADPGTGGSGDIKRVQHNGTIDQVYAVLNIGPDTLTGLWGGPTLGPIPGVGWVIDMIPITAS